MLRMGSIVSQPRPLKGLQKQRGFALQTVALLNKQLLLFTEEPERAIFIHWLHVTAAFFLSPIICFISNVLVDALYILYHRGMMLTQAASGPFITAAFCSDWSPGYFCTLVSL